jgi:hypothetical protein
MDKKQAIEKIVELIQNEKDGNYVDFALPGYAAKKIIGYQSMRQDLLLCRESLLKLLSQEFDETISSCLYYTFIALYGKCFTKPSYSKYPKLEEDIFEKDDYGHLYDTHKQIMEFRHNFIAHRGSTQNEFALAYLRLDVRNLGRHVYVKQLKRNRPTKENLPQYLELLDYLTSIVEKKFYEAGVKVWTHILKSYPPELFAELKLAGPR